MVSLAIHGRPPPLRATLHRFVDAGYLHVQPPNWSRSCAAGSPATNSIVRSRARVTSNGSSNVRRHSSSSMTHPSTTISFADVSERFRGRLLRRLPRQPLGLEPLAIVGKCLLRDLVLSHRFLGIDLAKCPTGFSLG